MAVILRWWSGDITFSDGDGTHLGAPGPDVTRDRPGSDPVRDRPAREQLEGSPFDGLDWARCSCCGSQWRLEDDGFSLRPGRILEEWF